MIYGFTKEQVKRILVEELEKSKVQDAADEIADNLESLLTESEKQNLLSKAYEFIFKKAEQENIDPDDLAIQTYKQIRQRERL